MDQYYKAERLKTVLERFPAMDNMPLLLVSPFSMVREWIKAARSLGLFSDDRITGSQFAKREVSFISVEKLAATIEKMSVPHIVVVDDLFPEQRETIKACIKALDAKHCRLFMTTIPPVKPDEDSNKILKTKFFN